MDKFEQIIYINIDDSGKLVNSEKVAIYAGVVFTSKKEKDKSVETMKYVAGVYTSSILFHDSTLDVQVIVDENRINSISLVNLNETVTTMYPLVEPALEEVSDQIIKTQSVENISYQADNQYTTVMLLNAVENALEKAEIDGTVEE